jgi:hypothetical protein
MFSVEGAASGSTPAGLTTSRTLAIAALSAPRSGSSM